MRGAAARSGVTAAALYHHFSDRDELMREIIRLGHELLLEYLRRAESASSPFERLRVAWDAYVDFAIEHPRDYEVLFLDPEAPTRRFREELTAGESPTFEFLVDRIRDCMATGDLRAEDANDLALLVWSAAHGLCSLHLCGRFTSERQFRHVSARQRDLLLGALRNPSVPDV